MPQNPFKNQRFNSKNLQKHPKPLDPRLKCYKSNKLSKTTTIFLKNLNSTPSFPKHTKIDKHRPLRNTLFLCGFLFYGQRFSLFSFIFRFSALLLKMRSLRRLPIRTLTTAARCQAAQLPDFTPKQAPPSVILKDDSLPIEKKSLSRGMSLNKFEKVFWF